MKKLNLIIHINNTNVFMLFISHIELKSNINNNNNLLLYSKQFFHILSIIIFMVYQKIK